MVPLYFFLEIEIEHESILVFKNIDSIVCTMFRWKQDFKSNNTWWFMFFMEYKLR